METGSKVAAFMPAVGGELQQKVCDMQLVREFQAVRQQMGAELAGRFQVSLYVEVVVDVGLTEGQLTGAKQHVA